MAFVDGFFCTRGGSGVFSRDGTTNSEDGGGLLGNVLLRRGSIHVIRYTIKMGMSGIATGAVEAAGLVKLRGDGRMLRSVVGMVVTDKSEAATVLGVVLFVTVNNQKGLEYTRHR